VPIAKSRSRSAEARRASFLVTLVGLLAQADMATAGSTPTENPVRGIVRAVQQASISTDLSVRVSAIHAREGEAFEAGDKLVEFDCRRQIATVAAADAQQLEMQLSVDKNRLLLRTQSVGKNDLDVSEARLAKARAEADALRSQLDQCVVIAPFRGRVLDLNLQVHEATQPGKPFIVLIAHERLELELIVPSHWLRRSAVGTVFPFHVDEVQKRVQATVTRTSPAVDPISQTIKIIAVFGNDEGTVLPGMSGTAEFKPVKE
jgi:membrane fusion protein, multidrug efflux system